MKNIIIKKIISRLIAEIFGIILYIPNYILVDQCINKDSKWFVDLSIIILIFYTFPFVNKVCEKTYNYINLKIFKNKNE